MPMALPLGELSPKVTERAGPCARFRILALSVSLSLDSLSSLCRLRDISLRPEGVFQGESQERGGKALASPFGRGGTAAAVTERARPCAKFSILALSVSLSLDSLSSLCRLCDISLRPEGVFQGESQERGGKALASPFGRGGTAAAVTERVDGWQRRQALTERTSPEILKNQNFSLDFMAIKCIMQSNR